MKAKRIERPVEVVNSFRHHLSSEIALASTRLLIAEWRQYWTRPGGFSRKATQKTISAAEDFFLQRCPWLAEAVELQRNSRKTVTVASRNLAAMHIDSLTQACDEQELVIRKDIQRRKIASRRGSEAWYAIPKGRASKP